MHGGTIRAENSSHRGLSIEIVLPRSSVQENSTIYVAPTSRRSDSPRKLQRVCHRVQNRRVTHRAADY
ncbi:MAG: hypothetical protein WBD10_01740 [Acidobacteriaceae bacterium]